MLFKLYYSKAEYGPSVSPSVLLPVPQSEEIFKVVIHIAVTFLNNSLPPLIHKANWTVFTRTQRWTWEGQCGTKLYSINAQLSWPEFSSLILISHSLYSLGPFFNGSFHDTRLSAWSNCLSKISFVNRTPMCSQMKFFFCLKSHFFSSC
jgi:hypothetical protein